jgi:DNA (cytosine-5)-methyltransferase 1
MLTVGSLFSGIGGFDLGFERAGMDVRWQCEIDKTAREVLRRHWPDATVYEDVRNVGSGAAAVDVVCGGFPCQDVSVAGRRAGLAGERSGLWFEFHRILAEVTPEWVVIENVPGLLSSNAGRDFATILRGLVELRYGVVWRVLDSQHFGVPQRRRRVFIVGHLGDGRAAEVLFEREGSAGDSQPRRPSGQVATASPEVIAGTFRIRKSDDYSADCVSSTVAARDYKSATDLVVDFRHTTVGDIAPTLQSKSQGGYSLNYTLGVVGTLAASGAGSARPAGQKNETDMLVCEPIYTIKGAAVVRQPHNGPQYGEILDDGTCYTLNTTEVHAISANAVRRLTPTECARLQGFPDDWNAWLSDSARYKQYGNAVTVNVAEWIGRRIVEVDREDTN